MTQHEMPQSDLFRSGQYEQSDDIGRNPSANDTMGDVIAARLSRRDLFRGALAVAVIGTAVSPLAIIAATEGKAAGTSAFSFKELDAGVDDKHYVAEGYKAEILLRWGDSIFADSPAFDPMNQTAATQNRQFGYNNDYVGLIPMPGSSDASSHALLVVNHEYTNEELMFPGIVSIVEETKDGKTTKRAKIADATAERVGVEMAAHGGSIVEIRKVNGAWTVVRDSRFNRRLTAETPMVLTGPVAGHDRAKTAADPTGTRVLGTINNCAGGVSPWGTYLMAEENVHGYFTGKLPEGHPETANHKRLGVPGNSYQWGRFHDRFDISKAPTEPNRFGYIVEVDPYDPTSTPKKRTALGRFKHEGAESIVNKDGRVVLYSGDDERFDYVYKFVTAGTFNPSNRAANMDLLDTGTLYVAKFEANGTLTWMPLVHGAGPLTAANGFASQADVLIETRRAADLLGATKMDRPEDVQPGKTGNVYIMLTNNTRRKDDQVDAANPRGNNAFGHIIEVIYDGEDHGATTARWEILLKCGDPAVAAVGATFSTETTRNGWFGMPDNCAVDADGRLWVSTDGNGPRETGRTDGLWAVDTKGAARGTSKLFFRCPVGAELCGPFITADMGSFFVAVQHPADEGPNFAGFNRPSFFEDPSTRWPDFQAALPPRPSVVVITRNDGGKIAV
jgi:hypothetical protein